MNSFDLFSTQQIWSKKLFFSMWSIGKYTLPIACFSVITSYKFITRMAWKKCYEFIYNWMFICFTLYNWATQSFTFWIEMLCNSKLTEPKTQIQNIFHRQWSFLRFLLIFSLFITCITNHHIQTYAPPYTKRFCFIRKTLMFSVFFSRIISFNLNQQVLICATSHDSMIV